MKKIISIIMATFFSSLFATPQAIVFDFGGVLTGEIKRECVVQFLRTTFDLSAAEFEKVNREKKDVLEKSSDEEFWIQFAKKRGIHLGDHWCRAFKRVMKDAININSEMYDLIEELKAQQTPVALLSNVGTRLASLIREFGLYAPFDPCLLSCEIGIDKPDPKAYQILMEQLHLPSAKEVVFIDDRKDNVDAALTFGLDAILFTSAQQLRQELEKRECFAVNDDTHPFDYDLHLSSIPGSNSRTMICCHGYSRNYQIAETLKAVGMINATLVSFNFPDHDLKTRDYDPKKASFGTIHELLPALYVLKKYIIEEGLDAIDLYGKSAGAGAVVNLLSVLNTSTYENELAQLGIKNDEKKRILQAIQNGLVILDVPLKSVEEIIDLRGTSPELEILAKKYRDNHFRPIDSLENLKGLALNVILHFQTPDEIVFNRDDDLYIEKLKRVNQAGTTSVILGNDGGHSLPHYSLWKVYSQKINENC